MEGPSRIQSAREQVRRSRYVIGALAGLAFLGVGAVARAAHPGVQHATASTAAPAESSTFSADAEGSGSFFGGGDGATVTPSQSAAPPVVQSGGS